MNRLKQFRDQFDIAHSEQTVMDTNITVARSFVDKWSQGEILSSTDFTSIYTPDILWLDHFFQLHLTGTIAIDQFRKRWCNAQDERSIEIIAIHPTPTGAVLQLVNRGIFARDMLPKRRATGKRFACHACYVLAINGGGLIERVDEYQTMQFDDGVEIEKYTRREGGAVVDG